MGGRDMRQLKRGYKISFFSIFKEIDGYMLAAHNLLSLKYLIVSTKLKKLTMNC